MGIQKTTEKTWTDHKGQDVPREYVDAFDVTKERKLSKLMRKATSLNSKLAAFKAEAFKEADALYAKMLENAEIEKDERKGNYTLASFDKSVKLTVDVSNRIEFDENINLAQEKITEFLREKTNGADAELSALVNHAFTTKKGRLDTKRIFGLFSLKIKHPKWVKAMELIKASIQTNNSVRYMAFYTRDAEGEYHIVNLNFSNV